MAKDTLRLCRFAPYRKGAGPTFSLHTWATGRYDGRGQEYVGYRLRMREPGHKRGVTLFQGEDYSPSPSLAIDSDKSVIGLMGFLTQQSGEDYTDLQLDYCNKHAESLSCEVTARFGED